MESRRRRLQSSALFTASSATEVGTFKFSWKIKNFSKLHIQKLYSEVFSFGPYKWRILAYPKGNNVDHLSIYLDVADSSSLPSGWSRNAKFSFTLINQIDGNLSLKKETKHEFCAKEADWGFTSFISHKELHDSNKGYLIDDTCIIKVVVTMYGEDMVNDVQSMKLNMMAIPELAATVANHIKLFTEKELIKNSTLSKKLEKCLVEFEKAKAETVQSGKEIDTLKKRVDTLLTQIEEMEKKKESSLLKQKEMFKLSKKLKAKLDALVNDWSEGGAKIKAAKENEKVLSRAWSKLKQLV